MAGHFQAAPFLLDQAVGADQERAALNAFDFFAVHDFVFNNAKHVAHFFFCVGNEFKWEFQFGFEVVVRLHVVARNAKHGGTSFDEIFEFVAKLHGFSGAAGCVVFGVKYKISVLPLCDVFETFKPPVAFASNSGRGLLTTIAMKIFSGN